MYLYCIRLERYKSPFHARITRGRTCLGVDNSEDQTKKEHEESKLKEFRTE